MESIYEKIKALSLKHHEGIFREDKVTPYYYHVAAVDNIVTSWFENGKFVNFFLSSEFKNEHPYINPLSEYGRNKIKYSLKAIAIAHDMLEDNDVNGNKFDPLYLYDLLDTDNRFIYHAIRDLTKFDGETYLQFIIRAKGNQFSRYVKLADLTHNMSDSKAGARKDKYEMAYYILTN